MIGHIEKFFGPFAESVLRTNPGAVCANRLLSGWVPNGTGPAAIEASVPESCFGTNVFGRDALCKSLEDLNDQVKPEIGLLVKTAPLPRLHKLNKYIIL